MRNLQIKEQCARKIKKGDYRLNGEDFIHEVTTHEGEIVNLMDTSNRFVARAFLGKQNKSIGWVFSTDSSDTLTVSFFITRLKQAKEKRHVKTSNAYRLFNAESDGLGGVTIDRYEDVAIFSWYSQGIYCYQKEIVEAFRHVYPECISLYEKIRFKAQDVSHFVGGERKDRVVITENDVKFATYMDDGLMTGIFLDQREVRAFLKEHALSKTVLNTFSYTGAFSVAAALGGAKETVSVDVAKRSIDKTTEHFQLNGIEMTNHRLYVMDVFDYMKYAIKKELQFDWVVLDPPSFARTKQRTFSVVKDYKNLLKQASVLTKPTGHMLVSTNAANLSMTAFLKMIKQAFLETKTDYKIKKIYRLPHDFTTSQAMEHTNYLKVAIVQVGN